MSTFDRHDLQAVLRQDLTSFIQRAFQTLVPGSAYQHNWHIEALAWHLAQCYRGNIKRLIITLPPRNLKSICTSVAFPAWVLGQDPARRIICASYANDLAAKHARDCRAILDSDWYRSAFPATRLNPKKSAELEFETVQHGFRYATSHGGALTGRGASIIIVDDPIKPDDAQSDVKRKSVNEWFDGTLYSRLDSKKNDVIIIVMQRVHVYDLVGHVLAKGSDWVHLNLPAIADTSQAIPIGMGEVHTRRAGNVLHPDREPRAVLESIKADMGSMAFSAQYQQRPVPLDGNLVKWDWFGVYKIRPAQCSGDFLVQSWDTASKAGELNDYSVCTTWLRRGKDHYLLDVARERLEYPALKRRIVQLAAREKPDAVLIEDRGSGTQLIQDLRADAAVRPIPIDPVGDKVMRLSGQTAKMEAGYVFLPAAAHWLDDFKAEILAFPNGRHDDQVDSVSQYLNWRSGTDIDYATQSFISPSRFAQAWEQEIGLISPLWIEHL